MGIFSDLLDGKGSFDITKPITALDRKIHRELDELVRQGGMLTIPLRHWR